MRNGTPTGRGQRLVLASVTAALVVLVATPVRAACPAQPAIGCKVAVRAKLSITDRDADDRDQWLWKWGRGEVLSSGELGDPIGAGTVYRLCVYAGSAHALVAEAAVPRGAGWRDLSRDGYAFVAPSTGGIGFVQLEAGEAGRSGALVRGRGEELPEVPLPLAAPVTVQFRADDRPLCLETRFGAGDALANSPTRYRAQTHGSLPNPPGTIPADDACNKIGDDGSLAEQLGAQMRRSGTEWATTCIAQHGAAGSTCAVAFPGVTSFAGVPLGVPSLTCPSHATCDQALGRVEWHAEDKFIRKCSLEQWALAWHWVQQRAGAAAPPDCAVDAFAPRFWGVYACYEAHYVHPLMQAMLTALRDYVTPHPPMTPECEGTIVTRLWWRLASDYIRFGHDACRAAYRDRALENACLTGSGAAKIDQDTWNAWCDQFTAFLRPVYEGVRAASGKPF